MKKQEEKKSFEERFDAWLKDEPEDWDAMGGHLPVDRMLWKEKVRRWSLRGGGLLGAAAAVFLVVLVLERSFGLDVTERGSVASIEEAEEIPERVWTEEEEAWTNLLVLEEQLAGLHWEPDEEDELLAQMLFNGM